MATIKKFEDLEIWQLARILSNDIYQIIENSALKNNFRLSNQIDGASGSIMDNIAEGFERNGNKEFVQFLSIAKASCGETRSQLYRILDRGFISEEEFIRLKNQTEILSKKTNTFINYLINSNLKGIKYK
ncbi:four helix bundle protein [Capnocytophaga stomatis]|uniref:Four helix bundle protein n=1 Tax=Capnocytophaga stomatis TaxID=1848904 RepID=A0A250FXN9_9FLAO|nr:four helix bundle protein [Capnocytophaga stomatis]ATA89880.1 four helix bundle protein [Capnocytophaga stomatis]GIJ93779.1 four helix bundle protein [Capnocytophaga stomatis]